MSLPASACAVCWCARHEVARGRDITLPQPQLSLLKLTAAVYLKAATQLSSGDSCTHDPGTHVAKRSRVR
jgi:hypothetical protein